MKRTIKYFILTTILLAGLTGFAQAAAFTAGNLVVCRVGAIGGGALGSAATAVFLDEYTTAGSLVQTIAMPTADDGPNQTLTASGSATSECFITRSQNTRYIIITGYDAPVGTLAVATTSSATFARVLGSIDAAGIINTSTTTTGFASGGIRSAASDDATRFWAVGSVTGVVLQSVGGSGLGTTVSSTATNLRTINIFNSQLYIGSGAGAIRLGTVGTGLPTAAATVSATLPAAIPTAAPFSFNGFFFADLSPGVPGVDTLYVADDQSAAAGAVRKYSWDGTTWTAVGTSAVAVYRGLTGSVSGGVVSLYTTRGANGTEIVSMSDTSGFGGTFAPTPVSIATASANTAFRGIAFAPIAPTAATLSIGGRVTDFDGRPIANAFITIAGGDLSQPKTITTGSFGYYMVDGLSAGQNYVVTVSAKRHRFSNDAQVVSLKDDISTMNFTANSPDGR
jgi:hypothetical protein